MDGGLRWPGLIRALVRLQQAGDRHPWRVDVVLAAATGAVSLVLGRQDPLGAWRHLDAFGFALTCVVNLTLVARRRAPFTVLVVYNAIWAGYVAAGYWPVVNASGAMLAGYTVAASRPLRITAAGAAIGAAVWVYAGVSGGVDAIVTVVAQSIVWSVVICYFGNSARRLVERGRQLAVLAAQLRRSQDERAQRAVTEERMRIAREMHDVVAHHMSVISVQAGLARYVLESDPPTARDALGTVLDMSGAALREMRGILAVLRLDRDEESYDPAPGLDRLGDLVDRVRAAGVPVELLVTGVPRPLDSGVDRCIYRIVQESLTNVLKHAAPARATATLHYAADGFVATVTDDGRRPVTTASSGQGLIGMAGRAKLYGGTLTAGARPQGGFEVVLALPTPYPTPPGDDSASALHGGWTDST
ncbi:sensor histidine kinase [Dactylosporangium sp. McL0621]|uniref:sensor histidine kinase n=1 Tax=Dactylosporangium sp. McL0621 TaxID=3415678 RepID=UPI003CF4AC95